MTRGKNFSLYFKPGNSPGNSKVSLAFAGRDSYVRIIVRNTRRKGWLSLPPSLLAAMFCLTVFFLLIFPPSSWQKGTFPSGKRPSMCFYLMLISSKLGDLVWAIWLLLYFSRWIGGTLFCILYRGTLFCILFSVLGAIVWLEFRLLCLCRPSDGHPDDWPRATALWHHHGPLHHPAALAELPHGPLQPTDADREHAGTR